MDMGMDMGEKRKNTGLKDDNKKISFLLTCFLES